MPADHRQRERGAAIAELAMVVPVMLLMLLVIFDLGRGFNAYISVTNSARHAARTAMGEDVDCTIADLQTSAENGGSPYDITLETPVESGEMCFVTVTYTYTPILPFINSSLSLPGMGVIGPLWDGTMSETAVSK